MTSVQQAKAIISSRIGKPINARLIDLPSDLRSAVKMLARQLTRQQ
ncbi:hypothetical protein BVG79_01064 [Ketogulonicigenium robustum]|uniref:Uncharacterized protein n=1 Tax=Ketogulonicigenium robustum TaxID=92947 RepID=A0A1W6NZ83_9RHOB|nr:hypothetical protein [Ketogulonicigenium robustum]ARO14410.1 hypothetical protein BVG79_01064 [Ketogulonicigenium robustum]